MQKSKACPFQIAKGLSPSAGNVTWKIPNTVPTGTYFIRSLVYAKNASDPTGNSDIAVAIGDSKGFFEVGSPVLYQYGKFTECISCGPVCSLDLTAAKLI